MNNQTDKVLHKYVDNYFVCLQKWKLGVRWSDDSKAMEWSPEAEAEDKAKGTSREEITMREFSRMASIVLNCLNFTYYYPEMNKDGKMAVLDNQM